MPRSSVAEKTVEDTPAETFAVCVARDRCRVHWGAEIKAREKAATQKTSGTPAKESPAVAKARRLEEADKREREAWAAYLKVLVPAGRAAAKACKVVKPATFQLLLKALELPASTKPAGLALALVQTMGAAQFREYAWVGDRKKLETWATALGVDVKRLKKQAAAKAQPAAEVA